MLGVYLKGKNSFNYYNLKDRLKEFFPFKRKILLKDIILNKNLYSNCKSYTFQRTLFLECNYNFYKDNLVLNNSVNLELSL